MKYIHMIHFFQNFISVQDKWEIFFWFFTELIRYLSALQIEFLNIFDQTENNHIFLAEVEIIICYRLTDRNVQEHNFLTDENAQKHSFLTKTVKNLSVWHKIIYSQSDFWLNSCLQWQHSNQILCLEVCFSNMTTVLSVCFKHNSHKLIDESWY